MRGAAPHAAPPELRLSLPVLGQRRQALDVHSHVAELEATICSCAGFRRPALEAVVVDGTALDDGGIVADAPATARGDVAAITEDVGDDGVIVAQGQRAR